MFKNKFFETVVSKANGGNFQPKNEDNEQSLYSPLLRKDGQIEDRKSFSTTYNKDDSGLYVWNDYASGKGGNDYTLAKELYNISMKSAKMLVEDYNCALDKDYKSLILKSDKWITENKDRIYGLYGITEQALKELTVYGGIYNSDLWTVPLLQNNIVLNERIYSPQGQNKVRNATKGTKGSIMVNYDHFIGWDPQELVLICEGEKDCLSALSQGYKAISFTNGANALPYLYNNCFANRCFAIVYDNDEAGIGGSSKLASYLIECGAASVQIVNSFHEVCQEVGEDITDFFQKYSRTKTDLDYYINHTPRINSPKELMRTKKYQRVEHIRDVLRDTKYLYIQGEDIEKKTYQSKVRIENTYGEPKTIYREMRYSPKPRKNSYDGYKELYQEYCDNKKTMSKEDFSKWQGEHSKVLENLRFMGEIQDPAFIMEHLERFIWTYREPSAIPEIMSLNESTFQGAYKYLTRGLRRDYAAMDGIDHIIETSYREEQSSKEHPFWIYDWEKPRENDGIYVQTFIVADVNGGTDKPITCYGVDIKEKISVSGLYDVTYNVVGDIGQTGRIVIQDIQSLDNYEPITLSLEQQKALHKEFSPTATQTVGQKMEEYWTKMKQSYDFMSKELFLAYDLTFNSTLYNPVKFTGRNGGKVWGTIDLAVVGDGGVGKTRTFDSLQRIYQRGTKIDSENSTDISLLGGTATDQSSKVKYTKVGELGKNNNGLVFFEEFSSLSENLLTQANTARDAKKVKISRIDGTIEYDCNVRWISATNPPPSFGLISNTSTGFESIASIYKNDAQRRRIDIAVTISSGGEDSFEPHFLEKKVEQNKSKRTINGDLLELRTSWVWGLGENSIIYSDEIEEVLEQCGAEFNSLYPGLQNEILGTNGKGSNRFMAMYLKIIKIATACAAIQFSTFDGIDLFVTGEHVEWAYNYWLSLYDNETFNLKTYYNNEVLLSKITEENIEELSYYYQNNFTNLQILATQKKVNVGILHSGGVNLVDAMEFMTMLQKNGFCKPEPNSTTFAPTKKFFTVYDGLSSGKIPLKSKGKNTTNSSTKDPIDIDPNSELFHLT